MRKYSNFIWFILAGLVMLTLHCRFEICMGGFVESPLLNGLDKLKGAFYAQDYVDLLVFAAVFLMLRAVAARDRKIDASTGILSLVFAVLMVVCISFKKFNHAGFLFDNSFQVMLSAFCIAGFTVLIYLALRLFFFCMEKAPCSVEAGAGPSFYEKHFGVFGFVLILVGWLFWILMNYPGTSCPDSILQLKQFLGDTAWGAAHPPLSTAIMGICFTAGRSLVDANFGYFLYCLFHTLTGAAIFAFSMKKLQRMGISVKWCTLGILYFAFTPFWGTYAQWFEKNLLYAEITVLQAVYMFDVIRTKHCGRKQAMLLTVSGLLAALLRNNGIYAIVPAMFLLIFWLKGTERKRVIVSILAVLLLYTGVTGGIYDSLLGISKPTAAEAFSIPFQQTARYVCEHGDEVTEYEKSVISSVLQYEGLENYDPVISDPIKILYNGGDLGEYIKVWFQMLWKHPGTYVAAFINKGYGYLAPVQQNIEAWIQLDYPTYMEQQGIYHAFGLTPSQILVQIWSMSQIFPLVKYLCTPGLYTWLLFVLALLFLKHRKYGALIMLVPGFMNVLVCLASPLASAIRYELPTVAVMPLLLGYAYYCLHEEIQKRNEKI